MSAWGIRPFEGDWLLWDDDPEFGVDLDTCQVEDLIEALEAGLPHGWSGDYGAHAKHYGAGQILVGQCDYYVILDGEPRAIAATLREAIR